MREERLGREAGDKTYARQQGERRFRIAVLDAPNVSMIATYLAAKIDKRKIMLVSPFFERVNTVFHDGLNIKQFFIWQALTKILFCSQSNAWQNHTPSSSSATQGMVVTGLSAPADGSITPPSCANVRSDRPAMT